MSTHMHHIAIAVHNVDEALAFYRDILGLEVTDRWEAPVDSVEVVSLATEAGEIELLTPLTPDCATARFVESNRSDVQ